MSRKTLDEGQVASKAASFNSLVKELEDPRTLVSFLPEDTKIAALSIPEHLLSLDEETIISILDTEYKVSVSNTLEALRFNFWMEYDRVQASTKENVMNMSNVYLGICTRTYWHKITQQQPHIFAFILTRPPEYDATMGGLLSLSTRRLRDILSIPVRENGKLQDPKILDLILKAAAMVDLRNKGSVVQRSETKNLTLLEQRTKTSITHSHVLSVEHTQGKTSAEIEAMMDEQIKLLEEQTRGVSAKDTPIEIEYRDVSDDGQS
jgi:hypothetical protein